jgi:hypothetical protein
VGREKLIRALVYAVGAGLSTALRMSDFDDYFEDEDLFFDDGAADDMVCLLIRELTSRQPSVLNVHRD